ncbi:MAG: type III-B CRISPR module RAMP protein Cmr6 [Acidobacteria bacterium]|nr:type III-B CRISPR module RAMP protein Cmr6 [Acidobacteriota bacterium]MBI3657025.1 type III-B CRISPR module RAMP protein Cmr6 [Acidobacteriota bacterium]
MPGQACRNNIRSVPRDEGTNAGLLLARFLHTPLKDPKENHPEDRHNLYGSALKACRAAAPVYTQAFDRWKEITKTAAERYMSVHGRLVIGLGGENVLETGITLHHTYGIPIIPGSALKGLAAHYCVQVWGKKEAEFGSRGKDYLELFGAADDAGHIVFHDGWITPESLSRPNQGLTLDVMTPHHSNYYRPVANDDSQAPTDFDDPNPVTFLSVSGTFRIAVSCDAADAQQRVKWANLALTLLTQALEHWGVGGKTSAGYGRMVTLQPTEGSPASGGGGAPGTKRSSPQFKVGNQVRARRIEDPKGKGRVWFEAEDGVGGVVVGGVPPPVGIDDTTTLWIAAINSNNTYNFHAKPPSPGRRTQSREPRR